MTAVIADISTALAALSLLEVAVFGLGLAYLVLILRQNILGWYCAFAGTALSIKLFWDASLLMESALHIYYLIMAVYGWWSWRSGVQARPLPIRTLSLTVHLSIGLSLAVITLISGYMLQQHTQAALPYLDSFTTWGAVIITFMVAHKVLENWPYWLVINSAALYMYVQRNLYLMATLMAVYLVMVLWGWWQWQQAYRAQNQQLATKPESNVIAAN